MSETPPEIPASEPPAEERLDGWKQIGSYLGTTDRTVQRWEAGEGLPVHRQQHKKRASVYAYRSELDAWRASRRAPAGAGSNASAPVAAVSEPTAFGTGRRGLVIALALAILIAGFWALWPERERQAGTAVLPLPSATPLVGQAGEKTTPAVSPDGASVAFAWRAPGALTYDLYTVPIDGGEPRLLAGGDAHEVSPAWSPDGARIAFLRVRYAFGPTAARVCVREIASGEESVIGRAQLSFGWRGWFTPALAWWPDGESLIAPGGRQGEAPGLFRIPLNGEAPQRLTTAPLRSAGDLAPALSTESNRLVFVRRLVSPGSDVFSVDLNEPKQPAVRLTRWGQWASSPVFSGDGAEVFVSVGDFGGKRRLYSVDPENQRPPRPLPIDIADSYHLAAAPNNQGAARLLVTRARLRSALMAVRLGVGSAAAGPIAASDALDSLPAVNPRDGSLAFVSTRSGAARLWLANADGSQPRQLAAEVGAPVSAPAFSPDGESLTVAARAADGVRIVIVGLDSGDTTEVATGDATCLSPRWSRDGESLAVRCISGARTGVFRISREGGRLQEVGGRSGFLSLQLTGEEGRASVLAGRRLVVERPGEPRRFLGRLDGVSALALFRGGAVWLEASADRATADLRVARWSPEQAAQTVLRVDRPWYGTAVTVDGERALYSTVTEWDVDILTVGFGAE